MYNVTKPKIENYATDMEVGAVRGCKVIEMANIIDMEKLQEIKSTEEMKALDAKTNNIDVVYTL